MDYINVQYIVNALVFSFLGIVIQVLAFLIIDILTPVKLWREIIDNKNLALAILAGCFSIAIGLIVSSAIHG